MSDANHMQRPDPWPGRATRLEFWLSVSAIVCVEAAFTFGFHISLLGEAIGFAMWLYVSARRLHDFNCSAVWAWTVFVMGFVEGLSRRTGIPFGHGVPSENLSHLVLALATVGLIVVLGAVPGTPGENRFGFRVQPKPRGEITKAL